MRREFQVERDSVVLRGYRWMPEGDPIGAVVLVHGMAETIERYDEFARFLAENGFIVYGVNQRGHGPYAEQPGYIGEGGMKNMVLDVAEIVQIARGENLSSPVFLFGHSMGSFIVRSYIADHSGGIDGAVISGTGYVPRLQLFFGRLVAANDVLKHGPKAVSQFLHNMVFSGSDKPFRKRGETLENCWLSRDADKVAEYNADPLCGQMHPASFYFELFSEIHYLQYRAALRGNGQRLLFLSGDKDPIGGDGKWVHRVRRMYQNAGFNTDLLLYRGGRHEMLNETNREEVYRDVLSWLKEVIHGE